MILNLGIPAPEYPAEFVDSEKGACLVVGGAACVWNDLRPFQADYGGKFRCRCEEQFEERIKETVRRQGYATTGTFTPEFRDSQTRQCIGCGGTVPDNWSENIQKSISYLFPKLLKYKWTPSFGVSETKIGGARIKHGDDTIYREGEGETHEAQMAHALCQCFVFMMKGRNNE